MKTITIKGIPDVLHRALKQRAKEHRRSLNAEAIVCLEATLLPARLTADDILARADALRERIRAPYLTDEELRAAREEGRE